MNLKTVLFLMIIVIIGLIWSTEAGPLTNVAVNQGLNKHEKHDRLRRASSKC